MPYLELSLDLGGLDPDVVEAACFATGALSVTLSDGADTPILEPKPGTTPLWPAVRLAALYAADTDQAQLTDALEGELGDRMPRPEYRAIEDRVWEREWLKDFHPQRHGRRLWICPGGQPPPADAVDPVIVWLDPGLAFGTGTHATTALCLEWLDEVPLAGTRLFDVGSGSGILAIAALQLGCAQAIAMDIDPQALIASRENAERNGVADRLIVQPAEDPWGEGYDIVVANILAEPLIELAPDIARVTRPGGRLVLSGLLAAQAAVVAAAYAPFFAIEPVRERGDWAALAGQRRH